MTFSGGKTHFTLSRSLAVGKLKVGSRNIFPVFTLDYRQLNGARLQTKLGNTLKDGDFSRKMFSIRSNEAQWCDTFPVPFQNKDGNFVHMQSDVELHCLKV